MRKWQEGLLQVQKNLEGLNENGKVSPNDSMNLLKVAQPNTTWSVVYDKSTGDIKVAAHSDYSKIYNFKLPMKNKYRIGMLLNSL